MLLGTSNAGPLYIELALKLMSECFLLPTKRSSLFHLPRDWYFPIQSKGSSLSVAFCSGIARIPEWGAHRHFLGGGHKILTTKKQRWCAKLKHRPPTPAPQWKLLDGFAQISVPAWIGVTWQRQWLTAVATVYRTPWFLYGLQSISDSFHAFCPYLTWQNVNQFVSTFPPTVFPNP